MVKHQFVPWPITGQVDMHGIAPIANNFNFYRMAEKRTMGLAYMIFPGAQHDRRQHCVGTYIRAKEFTSRMVRRRLLTKEQAKNVSLFALVHDIGHGPFSHVVEAVASMNHEQYGAIILDRIAKQITQCGGNVEIIKKYMLQDPSLPEWQIVMDKNMGMDKMDYLIRDSFMTEFGPGIVHLVESVFNYMEFRDGRLVIDIKALDAARKMQQAYTFFYRNVYLEKSTYITQRFMQKMIFQLLHTPKEQGGVSESELWEMVDGDLLYILRHCPAESVRYGMKLFKTQQNGDGSEDEKSGVAGFPKTALSIRLRGYGFYEKRFGKPIHVTEIDREFFNRFFNKSNAADLEAMEAAIAKFFGIESWKVAISHIIEKHRFVPKDLFAFDGPKIYSLKKEDPTYFKLLEEELDKYLCVRVCVVPEHREALKTKWKSVLEIVCKHIGYEG
jgi:hypothetical protein